MIDKKTYSLEWLNEISEQNSKADKILIEKNIQALSLLEQLKENGLDFIFKGGTALMLMLDKPARLSIDIDIIIEKERIDLDAVFRKIIESGHFLKYEEQIRFIESNIKKAHYKFFYKPILRTHSDTEYVLLDILFEKNPYKKIVEIPVKNEFLKISGKSVFVYTPSFDDILGDKLTAYAPNTTGIPYFKGNKRMGMEIMKQLYDIGNLFHEIRNVEAVSDTFRKIAINELKHRKMDTKNPEDVLNDIIETSLCVSTRGKLGNGMISEIQDGINRIKGFIYSERFLIEKVIVNASKVAYLANLIKQSIYNVEYFNESIYLRNKLIENKDYSKLNKLKASSPEAFYYWYKILQTDFPTKEPCCFK